MPVGAVGRVHLCAVNSCDIAHLSCRYDSGGATMAAEALSKPGGGRSDRRLTLAQIKDENLGMGDKPDWVQVRADKWLHRSPLPGCCCPSAW